MILCIITRKSRKVVQALLQRHMRRAQDPTYARGCDTFLPDCVDNYGCRLARPQGESLLVE